MEEVKGDFLGNKKNDNGNKENEPEDYSVVELTDEGEHQENIRITTLTEPEDFTLHEDANEGLEEVDGGEEFSDEYIRGYNEAIEESELHYYYNVIPKLKTYRNSLIILVSALLIILLLYMIKNKTELLDGITGDNNWALPFTTTLKPPLTEQEENNVRSLLSMMYNIDNAETLISKNDAILSHFTGDLHDTLDLRDSGNFDVRYSEFGNEQIYVDVDSITKDVNGVIVVKYTITSSVTFPSSRIAFINYNEDNIVDYFYENRVYPLFSE